MIIIEVMKNPVLVYVFLGLFLVASVFQLVFAFTENQKLRRKEKFLCMFTLGLAVVFGLPDHPLLIIAAFLGMLGDILVLRKDSFIIGVLAFFLGHLCYIGEALFVVMGAQNLSWLHFLIIVLTYVAIFAVMYLICRKSKNHSSFDKIGQALYFAILVTYIPVFIFAMINVGSFMYLSLIGSVIFIASDTILVITHFGPKFKRYDFYIMLTYLLAELLIISGFALTAITR